MSRLGTPAAQYALVTGNYWAFTLTDGALRMLVLLHFHRLGYSPLALASLFLFYEFFGVLTNLFGGWLGARWGLNRTMNLGLALQVLALSLLLVPDTWLTVPLIMAAQGLSGIAKDLNKMSAKSSIKLLVSGTGEGRLYRWIALLTGSKNALKGVGFFLGGALLSLFGFRGALLLMASALTLIWLASLALLRQDLGRAKAKPKFRDVLSKSLPINRLSAARLFLFAARDVWFVVALPVYLSTVLGWDFWQIGGFLAAWIIGYGIVQALTPHAVRPAAAAPVGPLVFRWALPLSAVPAFIALSQDLGIAPAAVLLVGLLGFGALFAVNSALHSYLVVAFARHDGVSLDVGFYYMSNAAGRLAGTVLSGWLYQTHGLSACLWLSAGFVLIAGWCARGLPALAADS